LERLLLYESARPADPLSSRNEKNTMRRIARLSRILTAAALIVIPGIALAQPAVDRGDMNAEERDRGFDFGWIGLLGLAGLAGLMGREKTARYGTDVKPAAGRV